MSPDIESPAVLDEVGQEGVVCNKYSGDRYRIACIEKNGVTLTRKGREYYMPNALFTERYTTCEDSRNDDVTSDSSE